ncbi:MAG: hypothetical protein D6723_03390, partial [Acidobacteria bacterium]
MTGVGPSGMRRVMNMAETLTKKSWTDEQFVEHLAGLSEMEEIRRVLRAERDRLTPSVIQMLR